MVTNIETDKCVQYLVSRYCLSQTTSLVDIIRQHQINLAYRKIYFVFGYTASDLNQKIADNLITDTSKINQSASLYFDKNCAFPRFKLQDTDFKRCVKVDKADYIVIPKINAVTFDFTNCPANYCIDYNNTEYLFNDSLYNHYNALKDAKRIPNLDAVWFKTKSEANVALNILKLYNKPFIYEEDLEKLVSKDLEKLDEETIMSVYEMLNSTDETSIELGCKLLASFDVHECCLATCVLLFLTQNNWIPNKASNATSFQSMLKSLDYPSYGYRYIDYVFKKHIIQSDKDRQLAKLLVEPWIKKTIQQACNFNIENCPFKIEFEIEIE